MPRYHADMAVRLSEQDVEMLLAARDGGELNVKTRGLEMVENKVFRD